MVIAVSLKRVGMRVEGDAVARAATYGIGACQAYISSESLHGVRQVQPTTVEVENSQGAQQPDKGESDQHLHQAESLLTEQTCGEAYPRRLRQRGRKPLW